MLDSYIYLKIATESALAIGVDNFDKQAFQLGTYGVQPFLVKPVYAMKSSNIAKIGEQIKADRHEQVCVVLLQLAKTSFLRSFVSGFLCNAAIEKVFSEQFKLTEKELMAVFVNLYPERIEMKKEQFLILPGAEVLSRASTILQKAVLVTYKENLPLASITDAIHAYQEENVIIPPKIDNSLAAELAKKLEKRAVANCVKLLKAAFQYWSEEIKIEQAAYIIEEALREKL